jgi:hypothetical protein
MNTRRTGWLLVGDGVWNAIIWLTFAKNLAEAHSSGEDRPTGYWVAHSVLIAVDLVIGAVLGTLGARMLRGSRR